MPVLVTNKFDEDPIKNEQASLETPFSRYKSMGNFSDARGTQLCREWSELAEIQTCPRFYVCPCYLQVWKISDKKQQRKGGDIVSPIISQWALSVSMETRVLIQYVPKTYAAFPPP